MTEKPHLTVINTQPLTDLPDQSLDDFKRWLLDEGLRPSEALRKLMDKFKCPHPDSSLPIRLIELTYPEVDISRCHFTFRITDSGYPNSNPDIYSDSDFDKAVEELKTIEPGW